MAGYKRLPQQHRYDTEVRFCCSHECTAVHVCGYDYC